MADHGRIRLQDIAAKAGVHKSTVSLALRSNRKIKKDTRDKILKIAMDMGYRPDTHLSNLMGYLRSAEQKKKDETIAYLRFETPVSTNMDSIPFFWEFNQGAKSEFKRLGYKVEEFYLHEYEFNCKRLSQVLYNRGIKGILVSPPVGVCSIEDFEWENFAAITMGYRLRNPKLSRVVCDQIAIVRQVLERLASLGYKKPLLAYRKGRDLHVNRRWSIAYEGSLHLFRNYNEVQVYAGDPGSEFVNHVRSQDVDCVIGLSYAFAKSLIDNHISIPSDCGFALLDKHDGPTGITAIDQQPFFLGQLAARQLSGFLARNETGLPDNPFTLAIRPKWAEGNTL
ncbi:MAG: LacI family transcriptional regulator [Opitutales bacterium]|nr:LacI family transcriptional regulator [Opitutales bacterium]